MLTISHGRNSPTPTQKMQCHARYFSIIPFCDFVVLIAYEHVSHFKNINTSEESLIEKSTDSASCLFVYVHHH